MPQETYPLPGAPLKLVYNNENPEYGAPRAQWEERVFRQATHFNVVRIVAGNGSDIATVDTYAKALHLAYGKLRTLIYVVAPREAFCMSNKDYGKFAEIALSMRGEKS